MPLTGITGFGTGVSTFLATPSSANLASAVTDETGSGALVFSNSPALAGTPTATTVPQTTNNTQIATTAYVQSNLTAPLLRTALGIVSAASDVAAGVGTGNMYFNTSSNTYVISS